MKVTLNLIPNIVYKYRRFLRVFSKKNFEFVLYERDGSVTFEPGLILLLAKADFIPKKQSCQKDAFITLGLSGFEIVFALSIEVEILHVQVFKIQLRVLGLKKPVGRFFSFF